MLFEPDLSEQKRLRCYNLLNRNKRLLIYILPGALYLVNAKTNEFELAASHGLSEEYLGKGPVSVSRPVVKLLTEGPVAIYDTQGDPRVQYVKEAKKEGIVSILSVPIYVRGVVIGTMRVYTSEHWDFTLYCTSILFLIISLHVRIRFSDHAWDQ